MQGTHSEDGTEVSEVDDEGVANAGDRLLAGEDPYTPYLEDAEHWLDVYRQLIRFKEELLKRIEDRAEELADAAAQELRNIDMPTLQAELERLRGHERYWERRRDKLSRTQ